MLVTNTVSIEILDRLNIILKGQRSPIRKTNFIHGTHYLL